MSYGRVWARLSRAGRRLDPRRFGRRGSFLLAFGLAWTVLGNGWLRTGRPSTGIEPLLYLAPFRTWALMWIIAGYLAILAAFFRRPGVDVFGYVSLIVPATLWGLSNLVSRLTWEWSGEGTGSSQPGLAAAIWLAVAAGIVIVSGWPEVPESRRR